MRATDLLLPVVLIGFAVGGTLWWQRRLLRKLADQAALLRENEKRLEHVLAGSEDGFWDWNLETGRIERSERWASMLGYTLAEIEPPWYPAPASCIPTTAKNTRRGMNGSTTTYRMLAKSDA